MRGEAMRCICERLRARGVDLDQFHALEFYAREGDWQTAAYAPLVKSIEAWEIDPSFEERLRKNLPMATIRVGNSYEMALESINEKKFSWLTFDNPQGIFGSSGQYCEHFEALTLVPWLLAAEGFVIFNVNWKPFNYEQYPEWRRRRNEYYRRTDTGELSLNELVNHYKAYFNALGFKVQEIFSQPRNSEYLAYVVVRLRR